MSDFPAIHRNPSPFPMLADEPHPLIDDLDEVNLATIPATRRFQALTDAEVEHARRGVEDYQREVGIDPGFAEIPLPVDPLRPSRDCDPLPIAKIEEWGDDECSPI